jgi:hypothetical protein
MEVEIHPADVNVVHRPEGYREFRCIPTHWLYEAPFDRKLLYTEAVSNKLDLDTDWDFWSASDGALRIQRVPPEQLDIREIMLMATRRSTDYNAPKPWAARLWVDEIEAEWSDVATHLHPFAKLPENTKTDLWNRGGMNSLPLSRRFEYPLQTGVSIGASARPPRLHEPWHGSEGVWYSWETLEGWQHWLRRQEGEAFADLPEDGRLLLFVSHRWESLV